ncbi:hypothetical protein [Aquisalimonas sp.]|uniref:hypothetical protein n=1 Tax=Aquisalimonas sp. TaxID=1872621 RepID=UPI0025C647EC|nr:hypothetical protein [Aquisalimonas sp.]
MTVDTDPKPTRKVGAAGLGGAAAIVLAWALGLAGVDVPPEVSAAFATLLAFAAGYLTPEPGHRTDAT